MQPHKKYPAIMTMAEERSLEESRRVSDGRKNMRQDRGTRVQAAEIVRFRNEPLKVPSKVPIHAPIFQPSPAILQFNEYDEFGTYRKTLVFRNNDAVPRQLRVKNLDSPYFSVRPLTRDHTRTAAGMEVSFEVTFTPQTKRDYHEKLICVTDREEFIVELCARGHWLCIDFPDEIGFGHCPVNYPSEQTILVRNIGEQDTGFRIATSEAFQVHPSSGHLKHGEATQITVVFHPLHCGSHDGKMQIVYNNGQESYSRLTGSCDNLIVAIDKPMVQLEPTYISLIASTTVRIQNNSDLPIKFQWKTTNSREEDQQEKERIMLELDNLEALECQRLGIQSKFYQSYHSDEDSDEEIYESTHSKQLAAAQLTQKFKALRKALLEDTNAFTSDVFVIEPAEGEIWSNSWCDVRVTFRPQNASNFVTDAYLDIQGREKRMSLRMMGTGLGPKAALSTQLLNVGEVFKDTVKEYSLIIKNTGNIDVEYMTEMPDSSIVDYVSFSNPIGKIPVVSQSSMTLTFSPSVLGDFDEEFLFSLKGSTEKLKLKFCGSVVGPKFHSNVEELKFGRIACEQPKEMKFQLTNTSPIPMDFFIHVPSDGKFDEPEFTIEPESGMIPAGAYQDVTIWLRPSQIKVYSTYLAVDIVDIGEELLKIPIRAESVLANVTIVQNPSFRERLGELDLEPDSTDIVWPVQKNGEEVLKYGRCLMGHPYSMSLVVRNTSDVPAKYSLILPNDAARYMGSCSIEEQEGLIDPISEKSIAVTLQCDTIGKFYYPLQFQIAGSTKQPVHISLIAFGVGPQIEFSATSIDFGSIACLHSVTKHIQLSNNSLVSASFSCVIKGDNSKFNVEIFDQELQAGGSIDIPVTFCPNDTLNYKDEMLVVFNSLQPIGVMLNGKGSGTSIACKTMHDLANCDFGNLLTSVTSEKTFLLENRSGRVQQLAWTNHTLEESEKERTQLIQKVEAMKKNSNKRVQQDAAKIEIPSNYEPKFQMFPDSVSLKPNTGCIFTVKALHNKPGPIHEKFVLKSRVGQDKTLVEVVKAKCSGIFTTPLLNVSTDVISFDYTLKPDGTVNEPLTQLRKSVVFTNVTELPLSFTLTTQSPFWADTLEISLGAHEETSVVVSFNPNAQDDEIANRKIEGTLVASHHGHPQKDSFPIIANVNCPNLEFDVADLDFGCILNETSACKTVKVTNNSIVEANFSWCFELPDSEENRPSTASSKSTSQLPVSPNEIFEIRPTNGTVKPGECQTFEITFLGRSSRKFRASAICEVQGGASRELKLTGATSSVSYKLDKTTLDFGSMIHSFTLDRDFLLTNTGSVSFDYRLLLPDSRCLIKCTPREGKIQAKESQRIVVSFSPVTPEPCAANIMLEIAHLEAIPIMVEGSGTFANFSLSVPRSEEILPPDHPDAIAWNQVKQLVTAPVEEEDEETDEPIRKDFDAKSRRSAGTKATRKSKMSIAKFDNVKVQVEMEANRIRFVDALMDKVPPKDPFVVASYTVDFGNLIPGKTVKKTVRLLNAGPVALNADIDNAELSENITIEPRQIRGLAVNENFEFTIQYATASDAPMGNVQKVAWFRVKNGPLVKLVILANITIPDLSLMSDQLHFGKVLVGQEKVAYLQIQNTTPVLVEWSVGSSGNRSGILAGSGDFEHFVCSPPSGVLRPNMRCNIEVRFAPQKARAYKAKVPLIVANSKKIQYVNFEGDSDLLEVVVPSKLMEIPPTLPNSEEPAICEFSLRNPTSHDIEVYSVELDKKYVEENMIISKVFESRSISRMLTSTRLPGAPLASEIAEVYEALLQQEEKRDEQEGEKVGDLEIANPAEDSIQISQKKPKPQCPFDFMVTSESNAMTSAIISTLREWCVNSELVSVDQIFKTTMDRELIPKEVYYNYVEDVDQVMPSGAKLIAATEEQLTSAFKSFFETDKRGMIVHGITESVLCKTFDAGKLGDILKSCFIPERLKLLTVSKETPTVPEETQKELSETTEENSPEHVDNGVLCLLETVELTEIPERVFAWLRALGLSKPDPYFLAIPNESIYDIVKVRTRKECAKFSELFSLETIGTKRLVAAADTEAEVQEGAETDSGLIPATEDTKNATRWILKAGDEVQLRVMFKSSEVGSFEQQLTFECMGGPKQSWVVVRGVCAVPTITSDPRNVFMSRVKSVPANKYVSKKYVLSSEHFEFGPLLVDRQVTETNQAVFRISNSGVLPIDKVDFSFVVQSAEGVLEPVSDSNIVPFSIEPVAMSLEIGETKDVTVTAKPLSKGGFNAKLRCTIQNNPTPVDFSLACTGSVPTVDIEGPWMNKEDESQSTEEYLINFGRLLLGRTEEKSVSVTNACEVPVQWALDTTKIPETSKFTFSATQGTLGPREKVNINVGFNAHEVNALNDVFNIYYSDSVGGMESEATKSTQQLRLAAETYTINVKPVFGAESGDSEGKGLIDFGTVRVFDSVTRTFQLENSGKYAIKFAIENRGKRTRDILSITPNEGTIEPNSSTTCTLELCPRKEIDLRFCKDLICRISDPENGQSVESFDIPIAASSRFSSYRVQPVRGVHFGALQNGSTSSRQVEIRNDGVFAFSFETTSFKEYESRLKALEEEKHEFTKERPNDNFELHVSSRYAKPNAEVSKTAGTIGAFSITPMGNVVEPGQTVIIEVGFEAKETMSALEHIRLVISGAPREMGDALLFGYPLEFTAESCVPGIHVDNYESIFEEQALTRGDDEADGSRSGVFNVEDKMFSFGQFIPAMIPAQGVCQRFKIVNPFKIKANVDCTVTPNTGTASDIFSVHPARVELQPHEHAFVNAYFKPGSMMKYSATFQAKVADSPCVLTFGMRGEGTLPCVTVVKPVELDADAKYEVKMGRLQVGNHHEYPIVLRNDGRVPATVRFDMDVNDAISCSMRKSSVMLGCGESKTVFVTFAPKEIGEYNTELVMRVVHNEFELSTFKISGTGYQDDLMFDNISELNFGDVPIAEPGSEVSSSLQFSIKSYVDRILRFEWNSASDGLKHIKITPSIGHLVPFGTAVMTATVRASESLSLDQVKAELGYRSINYSEAAYEISGGKSITWNNTMVNEDGESVSEPEHTFDDKPKESITIPCSAEIDSVRYETDNDNRQIAFKNTMMFQSRVTKFTVKNTSRVPMEINWAVEAEGEEPSPNPFSISPANTVISPGVEEVFVIRFAPKEVALAQYFATANIPNLGANSTPLRLMLSGVAQRPLCHFEIEPSDYLQRRSQPVIPLADLVRDMSALRIIEFASLGTHVKNTRRFFVLNPTSISYEFKFEPIDQGNANGGFQCATTHGVINPGKRYEVALSFTAVDTVRQEALWRFSIPNQNVSVDILLTGYVKEPRVYLDKSHINFHSVLVGGQCTDTVTLINDEDIPFAYAFHTATNASGDHNASEKHGGKKGIPVVMDPMSGTVGAKQRVAVNLTFSPGAEQAYNMNVRCEVHRKPNVLGLNVKGEGSAIHDKVTLIADNEAIVLTASEKSANQLDFGDVYVNDLVERSIQIHNKGSFKFDFAWVLPQDKSYDGILDLAPLKGSVPSGESVTCKFKFNPMAEVRLQDLLYTCVVAGARKYQLRVSGAGVRPPITFSSTRVEFGPCFLVAEEQKSLTITNSGSDREITIDCLFHNTDQMKVNLEKSVLKPKEQTTVSLLFTPNELKSYSGLIPFEINGVFKVNVFYAGEGTELRLELPQSNDNSLVDFGSLRVGQKSTKTVKIINRSKRSATFQLLDLEESLGGHNIKFQPELSSVITLNPRASHSFEVTFQPDKKFSKFEKPLFLEAYGEKRELLNVSGTCQAMDVKLEHNFVSFNPVYESCSVIKKVQLRNTGDLGARFVFKIEGAASEQFSLFPLDGFVPAGSEVMVDVSFHPSKIAESIEGSAKLTVEGNATPAFTLSFAGSCIAQPKEGIESVNFSTPVRLSITKSVQINNPSDQTWQLHPVIDNTCFKGDNELTITPGATANFEITYLPTRTTRDEGSAFFALPNGTSKTFQLIGEATAPTVEATIEKQVTAKQPLQIPIQVRNWEATTVQLNAKVEKLEGGMDHLYSGPESFEVVANGVRDYRLSFVGYKAGSSKAKVTLTNAATNEYVFYEIHMTCTAPEPMGDMSLATTVRQSITKTIAFENPFYGGPEAISDFESICSNSSVRAKQLHEKNPSKFQFEVEYRPLVVTESEQSCDLVLRNAALGDFTYKLHLTATPAATERSLHFETSLGTTLKQEFRFTNLSEKASEYSCTVTQPLFFKVPPTIKVAPATSWTGTEVSVEILFEPQGLGDVQDTLVISSADGGEFKCNLHGTCNVPRPQGPFAIEDRSKGVEIEFKNVFDAQKNFKFVVDSKDLTVNGSPSTSIPIQGGNKVKVTIKCNVEHATGKLMVSCVDMPTLPPWTFYIKQ